MYDVLRELVNIIREDNNTEKWERPKSMYEPYYRAVAALTYANENAND